MYKKLKRDARAKLLFCQYLLLFCGSRLRRRRRCLSCLLYQKANHPVDHDTVLNNMKRLYHGFLVHFVFNGSYASFSIMNLEKLPVNAGQNHSFVSNKICFLSIISNVTYNKHELWKTIRLKSFQKPQLQSVSIFFEFVHQCLLSYFCCVIFTFI